MNREEERLIDYLSGELDGPQKQALEKELATSGELRQQLEQLRQLKEEMAGLQQYQPSNRLRQRFDQLLEDELNRSEKSTAGSAKIFHLKNWRLVVAGAAAVLVLGIFIGLQIQTAQLHQQQMAAIQAELDATREQMNQLLATSSTAKRIQAVNMSLEAPKVDREMIDQLVTLIHKDESANVRLAAIEALLQLAQSAEIQRALTSALRVETKPVVQIALIHALVKVHADEAVPVLDELIKREETFDKVKDEARLGKFKLS